jgi:hypothetical protein
MHLTPSELVSIIRTLRGVPALHGPAILAPIAARDSGNVAVFEQKQRDRLIPLSHKRGARRPDFVLATPMGEGAMKGSAAERFRRSEIAEPLARYDGLRLHCPRVVSCREAAIGRCCQ